MNKNSVKKIGQRQWYFYNHDVLLNNKCLRHSMKRIQSRKHRIGAYESKFIYHGLMIKICILNNEYDRLGFGY